MAVALAGVLALAVAAPAALAEERVCRGTIGSRTVDDLRVPFGATRRLNGVRVKGNKQSEGFRNVSVMGRSRIVVRVQLTNGQEGGAAWRSSSPPGSTATCGPR